jgi:hypothetical protein
VWSNITIERLVGLAAPLHRVGTMLHAALSLFAASAPSRGCTRDVPSLDPMYSADHLNYLCMNYTRPTPLPCRPVVEAWQPRWWNRGADKPPRFAIYSWWPPVPADFSKYADAGFNLALTGNAVGAFCDRQGVNASVTHDQVFDAIVDASDDLARLGVLTVFNTDNTCNAQLLRGKTLACAPGELARAVGRLMGWPSRGSRYLRVTAVRAQTATRPAV